MASQIAPGVEVVQRTARPLTWRCANCQRLDGPDTGVYTDGCCVDCLYRLYGTVRATRIIVAILADGEIPHTFPR